LILLLVVALPVAALTETGVEREAKNVLGLDQAGCEPMTNLASAWTTAAGLPYDLDEPRGVAVGGKIYLVGGITGLESASNGRLLLEPSDELTEFDPKTETFTALTPMPRRANHIGVVAHGGDLYVLGGYGRTLDRNTSSEFLRYDPATDRWSRMPDMPEPRAAMAAGVVGDRLIVAGGAIDDVPQSSGFAFDFRTGEWSRIPSMNTRREHVGATVVGDELYVLGGRTTGNFATRTAEAFDANERRWRRLPPMPVGSGGLGAVTVHGEVIAVGGGNDEARTVTGAVQEWEPREDRWKEISSMRTPRHGHATAALRDEIWVFGGSPCAYFNATDSVEVLDLSAGPGSA
jgi:N-acetylneuraminic acid mutarotase